MRLNLGCGYDRMDGYLNVDKEAGCQPDKIQDLENLPWDFKSDSVDHIVLSHVLEHLGNTTNIYLSIMQELYRICKPDAKIDIRVPHPRHDDFLTDPTHIRPILPGQFNMYSKKNNKLWREQGIANTPLGDYLDIDFEVADITWVPDDKWIQRLQDGALTSAELADKAEHEFNIIKEVKIQLKVIK